MRGYPVLRFCDRMVAIIAVMVIHISPFASPFESTIWTKCTISMWPGSSTRSPLCGRYRSSFSAPAIFCSPS